MAFRNVIRPAFAFLTVASVVASARRPNIVLIVADDLGWNDVSFHGSNQIPTPNIDALAYNGIILNSHYVPALCTPSRASLLTGKYPTSMGMQHLVILAPEPWGLPLGETLMPEHFKRHGYSTHAIGKWHLGFHQKEYTPVYRGFDSHFGYWNGYQDYYDHTMEDHTLEGAPQPLKGYDMRRGLDVDYSSRGEYSTDAFTNEAVNVISKHNSSQGPLFLYLAHLSPHSGNPDKPFQAPEEEIAKHSHIKDPDRRVYAAMVTRLDEGVGKVVSALREADMLDNSIILFMSDNGAVTFGVHSNRGSNYPLRGLKESPWEGGVRGVAAVWSPLLNRTRRVSNQLMHVSDWLPTLYSAAGLDISELGQLDGFDLWNALSEDGESPRKEVFNNYDEIEDYSSLRVGSWKYIEGTAQAGDVDLWYGESGFDNADLGYDLDKVLSSRCGLALMEDRIDNEPEVVESTVEPSSSAKIREEMLRLRTESIVTCDRTPFQFRQSPGTNITEDVMAEIKNRIIQEVREIRFKHPLGEREEIGDSIALDEVNDPDDLGEVFDCDPLKTVCLFNLEWDPCERVNLARVLPDLVRSMQDRLKFLKEGVVKPLNTPGDPFCNPSLHNGTWTNWRDRIYQSEYERALKLFLDSLLHRDILYIIENVILKTVLSPFHSFLNGFDQLNSFISRSYLSAATIAILTLSFLMIYNRKKRFDSKTDSRVGEDGDYSLSLPSLPGGSSRFVKR